MNVTSVVNIFGKVLAMRKQKLNESSNPQGESQNVEEAKQVQQEVKQIQQEVKQEKQTPLIPKLQPLKQDIQIVQSQQLQQTQPKRVAKTVTNSFFGYHPPDPNPQSPIPNPQSPIPNPQFLN